MADNKRIYFRLNFPKNNIYDCYFYLDYDFQGMFDDISHHFNALEMGNFSIGTDGDDETLIEPADLEFKLQIKYYVEDVVVKYYLELFGTKNSLVEIRRVDNSLLFRGSIKPLNISYNFYDRVIKFSVQNGLGILKQRKNNDSAFLNIYNLPENFYYKLSVKQFIKKMFDCYGIYCEEVRVLNTLYGIFDDGTNNPITDKNVFDDDVKLYVPYLLNPNYSQYWETLADVLKIILGSFNCTGLFDANGCFVITGRKYSSGLVYLQDSNIIDCNIKYTKVYTAVKSRYFNSSTNQMMDGTTYGNFWTDSSGKTGNTDSMYIATIFTHGPALAIQTGTNTYAHLQQCRRTLNDVYAVWQQFIAQELYNQLVGKVRFEADIQLIGTNYDTRTNYVIPQLSGIYFRAKKITYDYNKNTTKLILTQC